MVSTLYILYEKSIIVVISPNSFKSLIDAKQIIEFIIMLIDNKYILSQFNTIFVKLSNEYVKIIVPNINNIMLSIYNKVFIIYLYSIKYL